MPDRSYDHGTLVELASEFAGDGAAGSLLVASGVGEVTGVALPEGCQEHAIVDPIYARQLGARLPLAADLHDAIYEAGMAAREQEMRTLWKHLTDAYEFLLELGDVTVIKGGLRYTEHMKRLAAVLGRNYPPED